MDIQLFIVGFVLIVGVLMIVIVNNSFKIEKLEKEKEQLKRKIEKEREWNQIKMNIMSHNTIK